MIETITDAVKQVVYKYYPFKDSAYFHLFKEIAKINAKDSVIYLKGIEAFLIFNFSDEHLKGYQGREIALFNSYQLSIYWLPGALPRGKGHVHDDEYTLIFNKQLLNKPITVQLKKSNSVITIQNIINPHHDMPALTCKSCLLPYAFIERELKTRIIHWLNDYNNQAPSVDTTLIFKKALMISDPEINQIAKKYAYNK